MLFELLRIYNLTFIANTTTLSTENYTYGGHFVYLLIVFAVIIMLAYFSARWINSAKNTALSGKNMNVIETRAIAPGASLQIVKVGEKIVLLGITKEKISFLTEINKTDIAEQENNIKNPFEDVLNKFMKKSKISDDFHIETINEKTKTKPEGEDGHTNDSEVGK